MKQCCVGREWREEDDGEGADRVEATQMWEKVQLVWALWSCSGPHKPTIAEPQHQFFNSLCNCLCQRRRQFQLQAHELEVQMWEPHFQPLIPSFNCTPISLLLYIILGYINPLYEYTFFLALFSSFWRPSSYMHLCWQHIFLCNSQWSCKEQLEWFLLLIISNILSTCALHMGTGVAISYNFRILRGGRNKNDNRTPPLVTACGSFT